MKIQTIIYLVNQVKKIIKQKRIKILHLFSKHVKENYVYVCLSVGISEINKNVVQVFFTKLNNNE